MCSTTTKSSDGEHHHGARNRRWAGPSCVVNLLGLLGSKKSTATRRGRKGSPLSKQSRAQTIHPLPSSLPPPFPSAAIGSAMRSSKPPSRFVQELALYAASAALSCLVLFAGLRHLDPNRAASQKAQQQKKEIAKRLGRPLVSTTPYEVQ
jgi:hypothetical protein